MQSIQIVVLAALLLSCFSVSLKRKTLLAQDYDSICKKYQNATFRKLNEYRTQNGYGQFAEWDNSLEYSSNQQVQEIIKNNNVQQSVTFEKQARILPNEYFSEIIVRANVKSPLPAEDVFATELLQNILQQNNNYLQHEYTHGAVAVKNSDANNFVVVIHLLQKQQVYESCYEALQDEVYTDTIVNGKQEILQCDQITANGGWTLIADVNVKANGQALIVPIDDKGLFYTELLFVKKPTFNFGHWAAQNLQGFANSVNYWRFNTTWFYQGNENPNITDKKIYKENAIEVLQYTKTGSKISGFDVADAIIFRYLPQGKKVNAFADSESATGYALKDNHYNYAFYLYVR